MNAMLVVVVFAYVLYASVVLRKGSLLSVNSIFVHVQMLMAWGTFPKLDPTIPADRLYSWIILWSLLSYMAASGAYLLSSGAISRRVVLSKITVYRPTDAMRGLLVLSIGIVVLYYISVGSSALIEGLLRFDTTDDVAGLRLDSYSGNRYLFPGYVNQFKNSLLPGLAVVFATSWLSLARPKYYLAAGVGSIAILGLLGTGQRWPLIFALMAVLVYVYSANGNRFPRYAAYMGLIGLVMILMTTVALGRSSDQWDADSGFVDKALIGVEEFQGRILDDQQQSGIVAFRYTYTLENQYGAEWLKALSSIGPGSTGSDLSNRVYKIIYGTDRGTAPPSLWGSIHHNFGLAGIALLPALMGLGIAKISLASQSSEIRNSLELMGIAGTSAVVGFWVAGSPLFLLNQGIVVYGWMWWWGRRVRHQEVSANQMPKAEATGRTRELPQLSGAPTR